jgi:hypothetical protein
MIIRLILLFYFTLDGAYGWISQWTPTQHYGGCGNDKKMGMD